MALDALANWLVDGTPSIEAQLAAAGPAAQIVAIFEAHAASPNVDGVSHMLDALIKMLKHSPKITVRRGRCLREASATCWDAWRLQCLCALQQTGSCLASACAQQKQLGAGHAELTKQALKIGPCTSPAGA